MVISNRTGGTCLIATFLSDLKRLAARNFSLPFLNWKSSPVGETFWLALVVSQKGKFSLCLVNLHSVEFWSEAIWNQPDAVFYEIGNWVANLKPRRWFSPLICFCQQINQPNYITSNSLPFFAMLTRGSQVKAKKTTWNTKKKRKTQTNESPASHLTAYWPSEPTAMRSYWSQDISGYIYLRSTELLICILTVFIGQWKI